MRRRPLPLLVVLLCAGLALGVASSVAKEAPSDPPASLADAAETRRDDLTTDTDGTVTAVDLPDPPAVDAKAWLVWDAADEEVLAGRDIESPRAIASLTKLMTALLVVEATRGDELVTISKEAVAADEGSAIGMRAGQKYPVDTLLKAMLVYSANDAAVALAEYVGNGTQEEFIEQMNERAEELDLTQTNFTSVSGLDGEEGDELTTSSPTDIVALATVVMRDDRVQRAVKLEEVRIMRPGASPVTFTNRNGLLGSYPGVDGVKTGHTDAAGYCLLVHYATESGNDVYALVMGEPSEDARERDARVLLDWAKQIRPHLVLAEAGERIGSAPVQYSGRDANVFVENEVAIDVRIGRELSERFVLPEQIEPPLRAGDRVGRYDVLVEGEVVASSPLYIDSDLPAPTRRERWLSYFDGWREAWPAGVRAVRREARELGDTVGVNAQ